MRTPLLALLAAGTFGALAHAASPFDGTYTGSISSAGGSNARCAAADPAYRLTVRDGTFNYGGGGGGSRVSVSIAPDGTFSGQSGNRFIQGRITGNRFDATTSGGCNYTWSLTRS